MSYSGNGYQWRGKDGVKEYDLDDDILFEHDAVVGTTPGVPATMSLQEAFDMNVDLSGKTVTLAVTVGGSAPSVSYDNLDYLVMEDGSKLRVTTSPNVQYVNGANIVLNTLYGYSSPSYMWLSSTFVFTATAGRILRINNKSNGTSWDLSKCSVYATPNNPVMGKVNVNSKALFSMTVTGGGYSYAELKALKSEGMLQPGARYLLNDYKTIYVQPESNVLKTDAPVEALILTASGPRSFAFKCRSVKYPQDIVYYDFENVSATDGTPRNGFILRRHDTRWNVNMPNDWRNIKWARFKATSSNTWSGGTVSRGSIYNTGDTTLRLAVRAGTPPSGTDSGWFFSMGTTAAYSFSRVMFSGLTLNKTAGEYIELHTFNANTDSYSPVDLNGGDITNVYIGDVRAVASASSDGAPDGLMNNVFRLGSGSFMTGLDGIRLGDNCSFNTFAFLNSAMPGMKAKRFKFGDGYFGNYLSGSMSLQDVEFKNGCNSNYMATSGLYGCTFGNIFSSNYLGSGGSLYGVSFGDYCGSNFIYGVGYSSFGNNVRNISAGYVQYCNFESYAGYLIMLITSSTYMYYATFKAKNTTLVTFGAAALTQRNYTTEFYVPSDATSSYRGRYMNSAGTLTVFDVTV